MKQQEQQLHQPTDLICLYIFTVGQLLSVMIACYSFIQGNPNKLGLPYDADHNPCGLEDNQFKFIYFTTPQSDFLYRTLCVSECPNNTQNIVKLSCQPNSIIPSCDVYPSVQNISQSVLVYPSLAYDGKICLPLNEEYYNETSKAIIPQANQLIGEGLKKYQWEIFGIGIFSIIISSILLLFIERSSSFLLWLFYGLLELSFLLFGILSFLFYQQAVFHEKNFNQQDISQAVISNTNSLWTPQILYLLFTIISIILFLYYLIKIYNFKTKIDLLILFLKVGGDFIKANKKVLIIPFSGSAFLAIYSIFQISVLLRLLTCFCLEETELPFEQTIFNTFQKMLFYINTIISLWTFTFIINLCDCTITGMVCEWQNQQGNYKLFQEKQNIFLTTLRFHLGSVAFCSLLISVLSIVQAILETTGLFSQCYHNLIQPISKHCYVIMHLDSKHFIDCGIVVRSLRSKEFQNYEQISELGQMYISIIRMTISVCCTTICFYILQKHPYAAILSLFCFVISFTIANTFALVYGSSSESVYILYIYNVQNNDLEELPQCTLTLKNTLDYLNAEQNDQNVEIK